MFGFLNAKFQKTKDKLPKAAFVAQRFLGHNCLRQHRCVRGQRVVLLHSMSCQQVGQHNSIDLGNCAYLEKLYSTFHVWIHRL